MFEPIKDKPTPNSFWNLADHWFRILEMALILGVLYYFKIKTGNLVISGIYYISVAFLYMWFLEFGDYIAFIFSGKKSLTRKWFIWILCSGMAISFYFLITLSVQQITKY